MTAKLSLEEKFRETGGKRPYVQRLFGRIARIYDLMNGLMTFGQGFREMLRVVRPGGRVVCLEISHPPGKIFGSLFHFYFYKLAPLFGTIIGKAFEEYNYLPNSLTNFPDAPDLKAVMEGVGWSDVRFYRLNGGIVAVHARTNPSKNNPITP